MNRTNNLAPALIDIGANLTHSSFRKDLPAVLERARDAGVQHIIVTGADRPHSEAAAELALRHSGYLSFTAGIHPHQADSFVEADLKAFHALLARPDAVAVGECGLDYFRDLSPRDLQRQVFCKQIELSIELEKPLFLHQRDAHEDFLSILDDYRGQLPKTVVHCFTGTAAQAQDYLERGFYIGITGWICDERRGTHLRQVIPEIPPGQLMIETDAPYLLPRDLSPSPPHRRNEPAYLAHIAATVAAARGLSLEQLATETTQTASRVFGLDAAEQLHPA